MRILMIEDEDQWAACAHEAISTETGWTLVRAGSGAEGTALAGASAFDVLVIDRVIETDGSDGLQVLARLRSMGVTAPALVLSSLGQAHQRVEGLEAGADDYLAKPFDAAELRARLKSLARRAGYVANPEVIVLGRLEVRVKARTAHWNGQHIALSPQEFNILKLLAERAGTPVSRDTLWAEVWTDFPNLPPQINVIDVAVARLRRSIRAVVGDDLIETRRLKGYVISPVYAQ
ncbi:MAG: response regulator transcription factor [Oceanicaulis sp.]|uniref:response regulator transcription factor n=1 Tax=Glycocaulis sp. TaxID=1969725 RepID=UPI0025BA432D|nr:response regulator transcription factor [Glycocaulis sp.]MCC5982275.1 response regulator transcription factor [Oceanicaulis sp.]MCH8520732.1 response regulator transcription factor [Glycocaulis sp.]